MQGLLAYYLRTSFCNAHRWHSDKEYASSVGDAGDIGSIPGSGRYPGEGNVNPLQYSCEIQRTEDLVGPSSVQLLSHVQLFETPYPAACQAFLSITISWRLLKLVSIG